MRDSVSSMLNSTNSLELSSIKYRANNNARSPSSNRNGSKVNLYCNSLIVIDPSFLSLSSNKYCSITSLNVIFLSRNL